MTSKDIPQNLRASKQLESHETAQAFEQAMDSIRKDLSTGKLARHHREIFMSDVVARTDKNRDILKADAHKNTTRVKVRAFVQQINKALEEAAAKDPEAEISALRDQLRELNEKYARLADTANDWSARCREKTYRITNLEVLLEAEREKGSKRAIHIVREKSPSDKTPPKRD
ncbi:hypothetical protein [Rhizobium leguminosarum]|uniref:hypothetical protein n=1 Tax=Rhizobium leguminosarum TaxID=384 RepID=UPI000FEC5714|nr:hypothetical protein [Rhizobium leguminosarum]RWX32675.1 hypothetical protein EHI43_16595 [Rhizobium leguminosarum]